MRLYRSFSFPVPNLHADWPVMEAWLNFEGAQEATFDPAAADRADEFAELYFRVLGAGEPVRNCPMPKAREPSSFLAQLALDLQRRAGHMVRLAWPLAPREDASIRFVVEYDHVDTVAGAIRLARRLVRAWLLRDLPATDTISRLQAEFAQLKAAAAKVTTPADARALISAARSRGVPWYRMDREPFDPIEGAFRLRPNGLLRFGHGCHQQTLDGVFCVEGLKDWHGLVHNRAQRLSWLSRSGLPVHDTGAQAISSAARARRVARQIGGPVWLACATGPGLIEMQAETDPDRIQTLAERLSQACPETLLGRSPEGRRIDLLWIDGQIFGLLENETVATSRSLLALPSSCAELSAQLAATLNSGCLSVALVEATAGWRILDFDLNPRLDRFTYDENALEEAARSLLCWLYPDGADGRIPIFAVTGTNGKTTTCHMLESMLLGAGFRVGLATSLGSKVNGDLICDREDGYLPGHLTVLDHPGVEVAILESTRGGARSIGLGFDRCDFSACLNVAADHLNDELGLRNLEELAEIKQWIALRAQKGVVLNADDERSRAMISSFSQQELLLVSTSRTARSLAAEFPAVDVFCTVEAQAGRSWITLHTRNGARPVVAVDEIPITLSGMADYNVSNAAHAVALCSAFGMEDAAIAAGLKGFKPDARSLTARLNYYQVGAFHVLFDYAHNPHGVSALMKVVDRLPVAGRKHLNFAVSARRSDAFAREVAAIVAGRFDFYLCTNYAALYQRGPAEIPELLRAELLAQGVAPGQISVVEIGNDGIRRSLEAAGPGDLLVVLVGKTMREQWKIIERFGAIKAVDLIASGPASAPGASA